jgi:hypothetical protein
MPDAKMKTLKLIMRIVTEGKRQKHWTTDLSTGRMKIENRKRSTSNAPNHAGGE